MDVTFSDFLNIILEWGWIALPFLLLALWWNLWINYIQLKFDLAQKIIVLELKIPQVMDRTPKSMEQVFAGLYALRSSFNLIAKYIKGEHQAEISMEIVSIDGKIHYFIRTPDKYKPLIESQIHSQYPDAEILEAEDYTKNLPVELPNDEYDLWGTELIHTKDDAYPIKTYKHFKEEVYMAPTPTGETRSFVDPVAALMEVMSDTKEGEQIWVHYVLRPANDDWQKRGRYLIDKMMGKIKSGGGGSNFFSNMFEGFIEFIVNLFTAIIETPTWSSQKEQKKDEEKDKKLSPGEIEVIKAIEENISKFGFHVMPRLVYIGKRDVFSKTRIPAIMGAFNQFSTFNLNGFKPLSKSFTSGPNYFFTKKREYIRQRKIYYAARKMTFKKRGIILSTDELATVYHMPAGISEAPTLPKVETKTVKPPKRLPTVY